jgi:branched-chain amino acid transport system substrate-binding protein
LSGEAAPWGDAVLSGANMAVKQWNGKGGVLGRPVALVVEDDKNSPDAGLLGVKTMLANKGVKFFVGSVTSKVSIPVSEYANAKQMIMITPISTNPRVTVDEGKRKEFVFRACYTDLFSPWAMAQFAWKDLRAKRAAVLWVSGNEYSATVADMFANAFKRLGGEITHFGDFPGDEKDFGPILEKVQSAHPDLVYLPAFPHQVNRVAAQARKRPFPILAGGDTWDSPDLDAGAAEGGYFTTHFSPQDDRPVVQAWVKTYREVYGTEPGMFAALGYDAANILLTAIQKANSDEPAKVRDTLAEIKGFPGVTGNISHYSNGNPVKDVVIMKISGGKRVYVTTGPGPKQP